MSFQRVENKNIKLQVFNNILFNYYKNKVLNDEIVEFHIGHFFNDSVIFLLYAPSDIKMFDSKFKNFYYKYKNLLYEFDDYVLFDNEYYNWHWSNSPVGKIVRDLTLDNASIINLYKTSFPKNNNYDVTQDKKNELLFSIMQLLLIKHNIKKIFVNGNLAYKTFMNINNEFNLINNDNVIKIKHPAYFLRKYNLNYMNSKEYIELKNMIHNILFNG